MVWPHRGQERKRIVASPQSSHLLESLRLPQEGHVMLTMSILMVPFLAAATKSLVFPPAIPTGKSTCTGGFMCLSIAFSGRPTRIPTVAVVCLPTFIPERCWTKSSVLSESHVTSDICDFPSRFRRARKIMAHSSEIWAEFL